VAQCVIAIGQDIAIQAFGLDPVDLNRHVLLHRPPGQIVVDARVAARGIGLDIPTQSSSRSCG
jgi:hypothetical protein